MRGILIRWLVLTGAILVASYAVDGIQVQGFFTGLWAAVILGVLNAFLRPVLIVLTLPLTILTFGLFTFVINAVLLMMVSGILSGFHIEGFWPAVWGSLIISVVSWFLNTFISGRGTVHYVQVQRGRHREIWR